MLSGTGGILTENQPAPYCRLSRFRRPFLLDSVTHIAEEAFLH
ncbi:hypothetical protein HMPREF1051_0691 [Neisseria sicca VK64]|uniref:Uncharacterized protein n=1 Tax=Neisseria sicca VK64 TaxID=1095748 RepID=I2NV69_NEISI|nr:hypothetical protein HMPREF1051_0691 [Neisseria sicca VK64]